MAPATQCASTGTCQSTLHLPSASVWAMDDQVFFAHTALQHPIDAVAGAALRSFAWCGTLVSAAAGSRQSTDLFTRIAEVAVLSCWRASSSASCTSLKATKARTKLASTSPNTNQSQLDISLQHVQRRHGTASVQLAMVTFRCSAPGSMTALAPLARKHGCRCPRSNSRVC